MTTATRSRRGHQWQPPHLCTDLEQGTKINPYRKFVGAFVPNWLAARCEISQGAKLAYGFLCQHAGKQGRCHPGQHVLATELGVSDRQVRVYLDELKSARLIGVIQRGLRRANRYVFFAHGWMDRGFRFDQRLAPERNGSSGPAWKPPSVQGRKAAAGPQEVDSMEGEPGEAEIPHSPPSGDGVSCAQAPLASQVEEIYAAYPKKVGKPTALRAIRRALQKHSFEFVLERTRLFAATYQGDPQFIPHPSTFYNQERYVDDPATWRRTPVAQAQPKLIRADQFGTGRTNL